MLNIQNASITFDNRFCLQDITLTVPDTGISVIVGANGSGKTLLIQLCAGLLEPSLGVIKRPTENHLTSNDKTFIHTTWVPQTPVLLDRSVFENIALPLRAAKHPHIKQRVTEALEWAKINSLALSQATTLSTGQQQLVALARAWALAPRILFLDEPCANLDPERQQHVEQLIYQLNQNGCKVIMSSHQLSQAKRIADDIVFLDHGQLVTHMPSSQFFSPSIDPPTHSKGKTLIPPRTLEKIQAFIQYA